MKSARRDRVGATRGKLALVGVLALVLVYVLVSNFGSRAGDGPAVPVEAKAAPLGANPAAAASEEAASAAAVGANPFGEFAENRDWPKVSLDKLIRFDPFAAPTWVDPAERMTTTGAEKPETPSLEELRGAASAIIIVANGHRVARIGSQDYHVGDFVGPYQITNISSAGIVLSEPAAGR
jgi:hypothetical protein